MTLHFLWVFLASFAFCFFIFTPFFEWTLHSRVMHRPVGKFDYAFQAHAVVHHQTFRADHTYHVHREEDEKTIPMAWWNALVLIPIGEIPFLLLSWLLGWEHGIWIGSILAFWCYYCAYEYMHWCMHNPKKRNIERSGIYFRLNGHHLLHHRYMNKNFNVVFPLADFCLGTLLLRSKTSFADKQPKFNSSPVADIQPRKIGWLEGFATWCMVHHPVPRLARLLSRIPSWI